MTQSEIEDTVADPYMGFNIGSCKLRQMSDGKVKKHFFESPLAASIRTAASVITEAERAAGKQTYDKFRVYLVAHSMGGLVVRAFLQNPAFGTDESRKLVDKVSHMRRRTMASTSGSSGTCRAGWRSTARTRSAAPWPRTFWD